MQIQADYVNLKSIRYRNNLNFGEDKYRLIMLTPRVFDIEII